MTFLKQEDKNLANNYGPVSVLHTLSKFFEKIMQKQVMNYVNTFLPLRMLQKGFFPVVFCMVCKMMSFAEIMKQPLQSLE